VSSPTPWRRILRTWTVRSCSITLVLCWWRGRCLCKSILFVARESERRSFHVLVLAVHGTGSATVGLLLAHSLQINSIEEHRCEIKLESLLPAVAHATSSSRSVRNFLLSDTNFVLLPAGPKLETFTFIMYVKIECHVQCILMYAHRRYGRGGRGQVESDYGAYSPHARSCSLFRPQSDLPFQLSSAGLPRPQLHSPHALPFSTIPRSIASCARYWLPRDLAIRLLGMLSQASVVGQRLRR
jgi:hypothetical protein